MSPKQVKAEYRRAHWEGNRAVALKVTITDGPQGMIGRAVTARLTFEQVAHLAALAEEGQRQLEETERKVAAINAANAG